MKHETRGRLERLLLLSRRPVFIWSLIFSNAAGAATYLYVWPGPWSYAAAALTSVFIALDLRHLRSVRTSFGSRR